MPALLPLGKDIDKCIIEIVFFLFNYFSFLFNLDMVQYVWLIENKLLSRFMLPS